MSDDRVLTQSRQGPLVKCAAVLGWAALLLQLYLILASRWQAGKSLLGGLDIFFSYFTVLTNLLVAVVLTCAAMSGDSALRRFFLKPTVQGGVATSIVVVGLAYNLLLRHTWNPQGLQWLADELLHDVMPVVFMVYWLFCVIKGTLQWRDLWPWLIYPAAYFVFALVRGALVESYPYPFLEVDTLGYPHVMINAAMILLGFILVALVVIALDRALGERRSRESLT
ncbi:MULTISPECIES: Pr6Pr family membrane protein [Pseudomonas]|uniref:Pr6Pr family membrane protein n=1 Tax=Pseudomonas TaxID=286 RepID=UPI001BEB5C3D|nr:MULTISPECIES: Pr6Pr family membrane protein [Pseudomonas]MBT2338882.1 Pr6Pr family membrane protein [Pseudomonas fluorescens]MCD4527665.1 Pr6Pr family membrane protein [Pseudomonas sp. C3-2018]